MCVDIFLLQKGININFCVFLINLLMYSCIYVWPWAGVRTFVSSTLNFKAFKGTVSVISSDPQCKDGNVRFTTIPLLALTNQGWNKCQCL